MSVFRSSRTLPWPATAVFAAVQDPARLARWWGPAGFSNEFASFDFRVGGRWVFTMVGPDGARHANESVFTEIEPGRRVVLHHVCAPHFTLSIDLHPEGDATRLDWVQTFDDPAVAEAVRAIVEPANEQNLDRLAAELARVG